MDGRDVDVKCTNVEKVKLPFDPLEFPEKHQGTISVPVKKICKKCFLQLALET